MYWEEGAGRIENCVVVSNVATDVGGGMVVYGYQPIAIRNCTVADNVLRFGGGMGDSGGGLGGGANHVSVTDSIVYGNASEGIPDIDESFLEGIQLSNVCVGASSGGFGIVTNPPRFVDAAHGDYRLASDSPCIDVGSVPVGVGRDIEVIPNFVDPRVFMPRVLSDLRTRFAPRGEKLLIHVSNFRKVKNMGAVVDVFSRVRDRIP